MTASAASSALAFKSLYLSAACPIASVSVALSLMPALFSLFLSSPENS
nr:MAG TPA: hypothetical protein [Caudoviricetes sp.]